MADEIKNARVKNDVRSIIAEAKSEVDAEAITEFKDQIKVKLASLKRAKLVVKNIEREMEDLEIAIAEKLE